MEKLVSDKQSLFEQEPVALKDVSGISMPLQPNW
jgi:hypothetical protein